MSVTQNYIGELGVTTWINASPAKSDANGLIIGNPGNGAVPANLKTASVVITGRIHAPHAPPSWKVK